MQRNKNKHHNNLERERKKELKGIENSYFISCLIYDMPLRIFFLHSARRLFVPIPHVVCEMKIIPLVKYVGILFRDDYLGERFSIPRDR